MKRLIILKGPMGSGKTKVGLSVKSFIHFWLLTLHYQPFVASTIASSIAIIGYLAIADSMAYLTRLFKKP